jgi:hypothetical protein
VVDELDGAHSVVVETRGLDPSRVIHVDSPRIAQALADVLEPSRGDLVIFDALPPWAHRTRWLAIMLTTAPWLFLNTLRYTPAWILFGIALFYGIAALPLLVPQKIAIGEDGILLRWAGRRRFVSFSHLRAARPTALGVELDLEDEGDLEIRLTHRENGACPLRATMLDRIDAALANHRAFGAGDDEMLLMRGDRDIEVWIHDMRVLGSAGAHGYRSLAVPRERLWAILENAAADPSARQGAALALRSHLDDDDRERLLAVAQKTASPGLHLAIEAVAHAPDLPLLRVALEESELEEPNDWGREKSASG